MVSLVIALGLAMLVDTQILGERYGVIPLACGIAAAGLFCLALGVHSRMQPPRKIVEKQTGRELLIQPVHSMYWIRAEYWAVLYLAVAAWIAVYGPHGRG